MPSPATGAFSVACLGAGEYSAERLKELKKNTMRYTAPRPSEPAGGVFKLSGSFKPAGAPAVEASFAAAAVVQVLVHFSALKCKGRCLVHVK